MIVVDMHKYVNILVINEYMIVLSAYRCPSSW